MRSLGRRAAGGALAAWALAAGCGGEAERVARRDAALERDLQLATAATVSLAGASDAGAARFLPAADEARPAAPSPGARRTTRVARSARAAAVVARAVESPASTPTPAIEVASTEPQPERMVRYAGEEGTTTMAVGVVLRGGAVGDDKCERELPRARPALATFRTGPVVRLGMGTSAPRVLGPTPYAPPF